MKIQSEFSRYADQYGNYNIIQEKVVTKLLDDLDEHPRRILDLGCGKGAAECSSESASAESGQT